MCRCISQTLLAAVVASALNTPLEPVHNSDSRWRGDAWFAPHKRGNRISPIEVPQSAGEWWFRIRHGDTFTRIAKVVEQTTEVLHFRSAKDDVFLHIIAGDIWIKVNSRSHYFCTIHLILGDGLNRPTMAA
jgi:hypothetical protein